STSPRRPSALLGRAARPAAIVGQVRYPARSGEIAVSTYTLPDLPYDYAALEPHISGEIMELHHSKHHKAYVDGANTALEKLATARESGDFATVPMLEKNLAFNL